MKKHHYPTRDAKRNYFPLPNEIFTLNLTPGEIAVYAYLMRCEDRETYQCHPAYATIGKAVGMSKNTVKKHVDKLIEKCLIYTEPTTVQLKNGQIRNGNLLFTIRPIQDAIDYQHRKQMEAFEQQYWEELNCWEPEATVADV